MHLERHHFHDQLDPLSLSEDACYDSRGNRSARRFEVLTIVEERTRIRPRDRMIDVEQPGPTVKDPDPRGDIVR